MKFIDLNSQYAVLKDRIDASVHGVLNHGQFIMGPEVAALEEALSGFCDSSFCVSCASGTDAILMSLMALNIKPGHAVFLPSFTFIATAEPVLLLGATPVFVDIDADTYNMSASSLAAAIHAVGEQGLRPGAVIVVDMHGRPADYDAIRATTDMHSLPLIADAAQSFGGAHPSGKVGTLGDMTCVSFFPGKPLGCYGDGGAVFTDDASLMNTLKSIRVHGKGTDKYDNVRIGLNSRLDTIQAAVLLAKLSIYADELRARDELARRYAKALPERLRPPLSADGYRSTFAYYTLLAGSEEEREEIRTALQRNDIPCGIYYPKPMHLQSVFMTSSSINPDGCQVSADIASRVVSLPFHPYLSDDDFERIVSAIADVI